MEGSFQSINKMNKITRHTTNNEDSFLTSFFSANKIAANVFGDRSLPQSRDFAYLRKENSQQVVWACSPMRRNLLGKRSLLADRKQSFEHLRLRALTFSTVRVAIIQGGQVMTTFLTDQLEYESSNEELVIQGAMLPDEADQLNEDWEDREWKKRWNQFPKRFVHSFLKLQSAIIFMRLYEHLAQQLFSAKTLDKLTKDPFKSAKRKFEKYEHLENSNIIIGKKMFHTCLWANAISFLSDYTVQQCILFTGHCMYYKHQRQIIRERIRDRKENEDNDSDEDDGRSEIGAGGIGLSYALKSSTLLLSRGISWVVSSGSGAVGSAIYPGWGTLFGTQLGDGIVGAVMDG